MKLTMKMTIVRPPLAEDSSDDELVADDGRNGLQGGTEPGGYSTDDELVFDDWYSSRAGMCRGERENVLGCESGRWDAVAWALSTGHGSGDTDPSANKVRVLNCSDHDVTAPGYWDPRDGIFKYRASPQAEMSWGAIARSH